MRCLAPIAVLLLPLALPAHAQGPVATGVGSQFELTFWQSVESGNDPALYEAYLAQYPDGTFAAVARVKLTKLRQLSMPAPAPVQVVPAPAPQPAPAPAPAPIVTAAAPQPAITTQAPPAAPAPAAPARKQLASTRAELAATAPSAVPAVRERLAALPAAPKPAPPASRSAGPRNTDDDDDSAPYVTAAPPTEPAAEGGDSDALRRLLGALGDSQRMGAPAPTPIVDAAEPSASEGAQFAAPAASAAAPSAAPAAAPARLVEVSGPPVAVPDAAALSARAVPATDARPIAVGPLPAGFALPPRPQLAAIPPLAFPSSFCSADARNAFHDGPYVSAVEAARRNNDAAIAYMNRLQTIYDANELSGDVNPQNAVAAEARAYGPVAAAAFAAQSTLVSAFSTLMAVPILNCDAPKQP